MKNYKLELNEEEKRLIEALLFNEKYHIEDEYGDDLTKSDIEVLELIKSVLKKIGVEVK